MESLGSFFHKAIASANKYCLLVFLWISITLISFSHLIAVAKTSSTVLNRREMGILASLKISFFVDYWLQISHGWPLLSWGFPSIVLASLGLLSWRNVELYWRPFLLDWEDCMISVLKSVCVLYYAYWLGCVEPSLEPGNLVNFVMSYDLLSVL